MWSLVRLLALTVLVVTGLLVAGRGDLVVDGARWIGEVLSGLAGADAPSGPQPPELVRSTVLVGLGVGAAVALLPPGRGALRQLVTLLHELGHTVVAAALGARPAGIVLRHDASGHATARWVGRPTPARRLALAAVAFAGVPTAPVAALAGARLLLLAGPEAVLWCVAVAGVVVAVLARSAWSLLVAALVATLAVAGLRDAAAPFATVAVVALVTATAVAALHVGGSALRSPLRDGDDARVVAGYLLLPGRLVRLVQHAVAATASLATFWLLLTAW